MASQEKSKWLFAITNGPSKFELMTSLFSKHHQANAVSFSLIGFRGELAVAIRRIEQEDGSGESWDFKGSIISRVSWHVEGCFSTQRRTGYLKFAPPPSKAFVPSPPEIDPAVEGYLDAWLSGYRC